jgi:hypothetical protein
LWIKTYCGLTCNVNFSQVTFFAIVALASAQKAAQYPAGVDPHKCPNFPICDNAALHNQAPTNHWAPQPQAYQPAPQWNQWNQPAPQQWQPAPQQYYQPAPAAPAPKGGDKYPAGVSPHACPNYPYCDTNALHAGHHQVRANPLPGFTERLYPAGVSAASCPNYPEC